MKLSEEFAQWVSLLREQWSGEVEAPLHYIKRFLYAFVGSFTFFAVLFLGRLYGAMGGQVERRDVLSELFSSPDALLVFTVVVSTWFAWLVSWQEKKYSPMRIYFAGLVFSGLVCFFVTKALP